MANNKREEKSTQLFLSNRTNETLYNAGQRLWLEPRRDNMTRFSLRLCLAPSVRPVIFVSRKSNTRHNCSGNPETPPRDWRESKEVDSSHSRESIHNALQKLNGNRMERNNNPRWINMQQNAPEWDTRQQRYMHAILLVQADGIRQGLVQRMNPY